MAKNNKYQTNIQQVDKHWQAQVIRQITSKKTTVTKQQGEFATQADAQAWADTELKVLLATLVSSNQRRALLRKKKAEIAEQRSSRRAEKTAKIKAEKLASEEEAVKIKLAKTDSVAETTGIDPEVDYDFDEFSEKE